MQNLIADICNHPKASGFDFSFSATSNNIMIFADEKLLNRALSNLIFNAIKHNTPPVAVEISLTKDLHDQIILTIDDNGRTGSIASNHSWGIGLTIAKEILSLHNAQLIAEPDDPHHYKIIFMDSF